MVKFNLTKIERDDMVTAMKSVDSNIDYDEPIDYHGADLRYEDYEPSPYDGTYSEM
tara:strand:- start:1131 stop:1298 length:168 start_codon:yes stop_codon:yes gene_type:complete